MWKWRSIPNKPDYQCRIIPDWNFHKVISQRQQPNSHQPLQLINQPVWRFKLRTWVHIYIRKRSTQNQQPILRKTIPLARGVGTHNQWRAVRLRVAHCASAWNWIQRHSAKQWLSSCSTWSHIRHWKVWLKICQWWTNWCNRCILWQSNLKYGLWIIRHASTLSPIRWPDPSTRHWQEVGVDRVCHYAAMC